MNTKQSKKQPKLKLIKYGTVEGYTKSNIKEVLSEKGFAAFTQWMNGQTVTVYKKDSLVYPQDLIRFTKGLSALD